MDTTRTIYLKNVTHDIVDPKKGRRAVLHDVSATLSCNGALSVSGFDPDVLSAFLHLLAGSDSPQRGRIHAKGLRFSPIVNAGGGAATLVPQISVIENIKFFSRMHAADSTKVVALVDQVCRLGPLLHGLVRALDRDKRRAVEIATIAALPYDCYLIDRFDKLLPEFRVLMAHSVNAREAGLIFATSETEVAAEFGTEGVIVEDGMLRPDKKLSRRPERDMRNVTPHG